MILWLNSYRAPANRPARPVPFRVKLAGSIGLIALILACANAITG